MRLPTLLLRLIQWAERASSCVQDRAERDAEGALPACSAIPGGLHH